MRRPHRSHPEGSSPRRQHPVPAHASSRRRRQPRPRAQSNACPAGASTGERGPGIRLGDRQRRERGSELVPRRDACVSESVQHSVYAARDYRLQRLLFQIATSSTLELCPRRNAGYPRPPHQNHPRPKDACNLVKIRLRQPLACRQQRTGSAKYLLSRPGALRGDAPSRGRWWSHSWKSSCCRARGFPSSSSPWRRSAAPSRPAHPRRRGTGSAPPA